MAFVACLIWYLPRRSVAEKTTWERIRMAIGWENRDIRVVNFGIRIADFVGADDVAADRAERKAFHLFAGVMTK